MAVPRTVEDIVCPFCSLACDDLVVEAMDSGSGFAVRNTDCPIAVAEYARPVPMGDATIDGAPAALEAAVARAAALLGESQLPLFAGLGTDVAGMREALALAEEVGGIVDHAHAGGLMANLRAMQDGGWVAATLAEVRNRAELVLFVGTDTRRATPRLAERCFAPAAGLFGPIRRELIVLGNDLEPPDGAKPASIIPCPVDRLLEIVTVLRAMVAGARLQAETVAGIDMDELQGLAQRLLASPYSVIVWAAGELPPRHREPIVAQLAGLTRDLNRTTRCAGLPLAGPDNVIGCNQVCGWTTGVPLRTSFATGAPDHDPQRWQTEALLHTGAVDGLVWISGLRELPVPAADVPTIALASSAVPTHRPLAVHIPIGRPGLDHAGSVYRTDGVVSLPVQRLRDTGLPSAAEVLRRIRRQLKPA